MDLDPCANERSHIEAGISLRLESGDDGLVEDYGAPGVFHYHVWGAKALDRGGGDLCVAHSSYRVFINPPYAHGQVIRWIRHYAHTRFIYLLRWDPSTEWFAELMTHCTHVWFPPDRVDFEPPPRIKSSSNPYPHALYLRDPPADLLERLRTTGYLFEVPLAHGRSKAGSAAAGKQRGESRGDGDGGGDASRADGPHWVHPDTAATKAHYERLIDILNADIEAGIIKT